MRRPSGCDRRLSSNRKGVSLVLRSLRRRNQPESAFGIEATFKRPCLLKHEFERRPHDCFVPMAAARRAVATAQHNVNVRLRFAVFQGNIAREDEDFDLFLYRQLMVFFSFPSRNRPASPS